MIIRVSPSTLSGEVQAPPSKSAMQRLVAGALLAEETSTLHNISQSDDCTAALLLAAQLGAEIVEANENKSILPNLQGESLPPFNTLINMAQAQSVVNQQTSAPLPCTF